MKQILTGLERLLTCKTQQNKISGNIAYLCHSASVDHNLDIGIIGIKRIYGHRLKKIFGPQHGLVSDVQDNMVETDHFNHSYFNLPVYSLYSETRSPTREMLEGIDTFIIDLQDVGTRVYTYIATMTNTLIECSKMGIKVVILDRPNPVGLEIIEGNLLSEDFFSFVGPLKIPQRHAMTMGEVAKFAVNEKNLDLNLDVIEVKGITRSDTVFDYKHHWINPSPNLSTKESAFTFAGTVLFEGTNISEGRGTTRALEYVGHPKIDNYNLLDKLDKIFLKSGLKGFKLRPICFHPMFQKHKETTCQGFQIHLLDPQTFRPWKVSQILCREFYHHLGKEFEWNKSSYEYEHDRLSIDLINGNEQIRKWVERAGSLEELKELENHGLDEYLKKRNQVMIYK